MTGIEPGAAAGEVAEGGDLLAAVSAVVGRLGFDGMPADEREGWLRTFTALDGVVAAGRSRALAAESAGRRRKAAERSADLVRTTGMSGGEARRAVRLADALEASPTAAKALADGEITAGHATTLAHGIPWLYRGAAEADPTLLDAARTQTVDRFAETVADWTRQADGDLDGRRLAARQHRDRRAGWTVRADGMVHLDALLAPDAGTIVTNALHARAEHLWRTEDGRPADGSGIGADGHHLARTTAQRNADALLDMARSFSATPSGARSGSDTSSDTGASGQDTAGRPRVDLLVTVGLDRLQMATGHGAGHCKTADGVPLAPAMVRRLACDAGIIPVVLGSDGDVLDVGRRTRSVGTALRNALVVRDGGCTFPGCDKPAGWCDAHHLRHWADGGPTDLDNLALLCSAHHHVVHEGAWRLTREPGGPLVFRSPSDRRYEVGPRGHPPRVEPAPNSRSEPPDDAAPNSRSEPPDGPRPSAEPRAA